METSTSKEPATQLAMLSSFDITQSSINESLVTPEQMRTSATPSKQQT